MCLFVFFSRGQDHEVVEYRIQIARFIFAFLIHFQLETSVTSGVQMMRYVGTHADRFDKPYVSFLMGFMPFLTVILIEIVNIQNLTNIGSLVDLVLNYVALGAVAEFDLNFLEMYKRVSYASFL